MRLAGRVLKIDKFWMIEVPLLCVVTQGLTKKEAYEMIADVIELLVDIEGFEIEVFPGPGEYFEIGSGDVVSLTAFLLRRQRTDHGLSFAEVAERLGAKSVNTYTRYEEGKSVPTIEKLDQLLTAISPGEDFVLMESVCS